MTKAINKRIIIAAVLQLFCLALLVTALIAAVMVTIHGIKPEIFVFIAVALACLSALVLMYKNEEPTNGEFALKISIDIILVLFSAIILILYCVSQLRFKMYFWIPAVCSVAALFLLVFDIALTKIPKWYRITQIALIAVAFLIAMPMAFDYLSVAIKKEGLFLGKAIGNL